MIFQSTLSLRRATLIYGFGKGVYRFQSTLSLRRATSGDQRVLGIQGISIHALLAESDGRLPIRLCTARKFQSTLSLRRATAVEIVRPNIINISIHALLAESDIMQFVMPCSRQHFNPRSPCGERRL